MIEVLKPSSFTILRVNLLEPDIIGVVVKRITLERFVEVVVINIKWGLG